MLSVTMKHFLKLLLALALVASVARAADEAKLKLAHDAIKAMQADKTFDAMANQMKVMAKQMSGGAAANLTPEQKAQSDLLQEKIVELSMDSAKAMVARLDEIYADVFSEGELKAMITFFQSSEGQSMQSKQPQLMQRMMPLVQEMQRSMMPKIQKLVEESKIGAAPAAPAMPSLPAAPAASTAPAMPKPPMTK